jgi:hypothetical protein
VSELSEMTKRRVWYTRHEIFKFRIDFQKLNEDRLNEVLELEEAKQYHQIRRGGVQVRRSYYGGKPSSVSLPSFLTSIPKFISKSSKKIFYKQDDVDSSHHGGSSRNRRRCGATN